eukprot:TRINITY_DN11792_c0_g1_i1.p2 TRINITY_DN11792_c0_g1~~TRINITY_DN11792_c0_g1_i1.p2  ORF type:complete len:227 (+),score=27.83 TRINITY_DN11792_c0_g1_i1:113-793(+)
MPTEEMYDSFGSVLYRTTLEEVRQYGEHHPHHHSHSPTHSHHSHFLSERHPAERFTHTLPSEESDSDTFSGGTSSHGGGAGSGSELPPALGVLVVGPEGDALRSLHGALTAAPVFQRLHWRVAVANTVSQIKPRLTDPRAPLTSSSSFSARSMARRPLTACRSSKPCGSGSSGTGRPPASLWVSASRPPRPPPPGIRRRTWRGPSPSAPGGPCTSTSPKPSGVAAQ